jgi:hypothetical protein
MWERERRRDAGVSGPGRRGGGGRAGRVEACGRLLHAGPARRHPAPAAQPTAPPPPTLRVTMMRRGCSSTGSDRTSAATSSAVFHLASWDRRFWPAHTLRGDRVRVRAVAETRF